MCKQWNCCKWQYEYLDGEVIVNNNVIPIGTIHNSFVGGVWGVIVGMLFRNKFRMTEVVHIFFILGIIICKM